MVVKFPLGRALHLDRLQGHVGAIQQRIDVRDAAVFHATDTRTQLQLVVLLPGHDEIIERTGIRLAIRHQILFLLIGEQHQKRIGQHTRDEHRAGRFALQYPRKGLQQRIPF